MFVMLITCLLIIKHVISITNIQSLLLNHYFWNFIAPAPPKSSVAQTIQSCLSSRPGCIKCSCFIFSWCGITCHTYFFRDNESTLKELLWIVLVIWGMMWEEHLIVVVISCCHTSYLSDVSCWNSFTNILF